MKGSRSRRRPSDADDGHGALGFPDPGPSLPHRRGRTARLLRTAARAALRLTGWRIEGALPDIPRAVVVVAPHTSNWDFVIGIAAVFALGVRVAWLGKHTLFSGPLGPLMRALDGVPVDRTRPGRAVEAAVGRLGESPRMLLGLSPEGTRRPVPRWHRGFSHIAAGAGVPIVPAALDYRARRIRLGIPIAPAGDAEVDLERLRSFFVTTVPRNPDGWRPDFN